MCWSNYMATPIVLKKPLKVYKVGTAKTLGIFISLYQNFRYYKSQTMPIVKIGPKFERCRSVMGCVGELWNYDRFYIHEGYHSYLTEEMAKGRMYSAEIGIFEIPVGACSSIWNNNNEVIGKEKGVSVYEAHKNINGIYSPVLPFPTNEMAFNDFIYNVKYFTGNKYLVTGDLLDETGTDGEPLIKNVKILKKLQLWKQKI